MTSTSQLELACRDACSLLDTLSGGEILDEGREETEVPLTTLLTTSSGLAFTWSTTAGVGIGITKGHGFYINYEQGKWSAPCFVTVTSGQAGIILGAEKASCSKFRAVELHYL